MDDNKIISGCMTCYGSSTRWSGKNARELAKTHSKETGHEIWVDEIVLKKKDPALGSTKKEFREIKKKIFKKSRLSKYNMCDGKVAHRSAAAAQKAINNMLGDRSFLNFYKCLYCGKYHVGHIIKPTETKNA